MRLCTTLMVAAAMLSGCSSPAEVEDEVGSPGGPIAAATASAGNKVGSAAGGAGAVAIAEDTEVYSFEYAYPAQASSISQLAAELDRRKAEARTTLVSEAESDRKGAEEAGYPYRQHSFAEEWKVVADLAGWLSLTGEFATYSGGAHGNYGVTSLVWDKTASVALQGSDMFISPARLGSAVGDRFCKALDRRRAQKRGSEAMSEGMTSFTNCPAMTELTIIPGSKGGKAFDRVGFYAGPYVAGPYAEGSYEVTLPVDAAILAAVKPAYKSAFVVQR